MSRIQVLKENSDGVACPGGGELQGCEWEVAVGGKGEKRKRRGSQEAMGAGQVPGRGHWKEKRNSNVKCHSLPSFGGTRGQPWGRDTLGLCWVPDQKGSKVKPEPLGWSEGSREWGGTSLIPQSPLPFLFRDSPILGLLLKASLPSSMYHVYAGNA